MLSGAAPAMLPDVPIEQEVLPTIESTTPVEASGAEVAWDAALGQSRLADLLETSTASAITHAEEFRDGLSQLDRYLGRTWSRAGIPPQKHDDCSQAVYLILLQSLGRDGFDHLVVEIGQFGIRDVLSRETAEGPDFFRAIDTVKKRAHRERGFLPLDGVADPQALSSIPDLEWQDTIREAIDRTLSPREAALIQATLDGETPAEIAEQWGMAPKTVSNEKSRAFQKLREFLVTDLIDD